MMEVWPTEPYAKLCQMPLRYHERRQTISRNSAERETSDMLAQDRAWWHEYIDALCIPVGTTGVD